MRRKIKAILSVAGLHQRKQALIFLGTLGTLVLLTALVYAPLIFGKRTVYSGLDNIDQFYTWYQKLSVSFHQGDYAFWDANVLGGKSFIGETQPGMLYPINLLWIVLFGSAQGISRFSLEILVVLHGFIGIAGMYYLARCFKVRRSYAFIAGMTYAASGPVIARTPAQICIFYGLTWMPFAVAYLLKALQNKSMSYALVAGSITGLIALTGHLQPFIHIWMIFVAILATTLLRRLLPLKRLFMIGVALGIGTILVGGLQIVTSYRWLGESYRLFSDGYHSLDERPSLGSFVKDFTVEPKDAGNFIEPGFLDENNSLFMGLLVPVTFASYLILRKNKRRFFTEEALLSKENNTLMLSLVIAGVFGFIMSIGYRTFLPALVYYIPFIGSTVRQLSRYTILLHLVLSLLFALCLQKVDWTEVSTYIRKKKRYSLAIALLLVAQASYFLLLPRRSINFFYRMDIVVICAFLAVLVLLRFVVSSKIYRFFMPIILVLNVAVSSQLNVWFYSMEIKEKAMPEHVYARNDIITFLESKSNSGTRVLVLENALPQNVGDVYDIHTVTGYGATIFKPYLDFIQSDRKSVGVSIPTTSEYADALGVQYVVSKSKLALPLVASQGKKKVYERTGFYQKITLIDNANEQSLIPFTIDQYKNTLQEYTVESSQQGRLLFTEFAAQGWRATVDGAPTPIQPYDPIKKEQGGPFITIPIEKGLHKIRLSYHPFIL